MPKLPSLDARKVIRALRRAGFEEVRQNGSHRLLRSADTSRVVVVPDHGAKSIKTGTLRGIITSAGLTASEFSKLL